MHGLIGCGAASGAFTSIILTPVELIKCQMQVPISEPGQIGPRPLTLISSIFRHYGILGFWHGQMGTLIRETGGSAAWFGSYEGITLFFRRMSRIPPTSNEAPFVTTTTLPPLPLYQQMFAGATAGIAYNFIFYPADTIKSRMQTDSVSPLTVRKTFVGEAKDLWIQQGVKGYYRGCGMTVARSAPSSAFIFTVYEGLRHAFG